MTAMPFDAVIAGLQRAALGVDRAEGALNELAAQVAVPVPRLPAAPLARTFVLAGAHRRPATEMARAREPAHVTACFSHDGGRHHPIHPGDRVQPRQHRLERAQTLVDLGVQALECLVEIIDFFLNDTATTEIYTLSLPHARGK